MFKIAKVQHYTTGIFIYVNKIYLFNLFTFVMPPNYKKLIEM